MTETSPSKKYPAFLLHILGWIFLAFLMTWQPLSWQIELPHTFWIKGVAQFCLLIVLFYLNYYLFYPKFLAKNKVLYFIVLNVLAVVVLAYAIEQVKILINHGDYMERAFQAARESPGPKKPKDKIDTFALLTALIIIGVSTSIAAVRNAQLDREFRQELEQQKIKSELSFLKAQINPHFFFNTLNNIYALTLIDVEAAQKALHKLSRLMRYVLYETQRETVRLSEEIAFAQDYIQLMQLRLTDKVRVTLTPPSELVDVPIAPMLFLPFIENAFKHGVSATDPSEIEITISQEQNTLHVEVINTLFIKKSVSLDGSNGIGLTNTQRRLDLLYPDRYQLEVKEDIANKAYEVRLSLQTI
ncbi:histidine kinase [Dyadobacter jejuensis]|uniref:Histidine kinase n=1 Tax=Dyadobacter jejuensis TaxID=1082580 RepID=A0A316AL31_9BACT|nr:histidine kinase [Dyadobacter jejuensis]PWJ57560.1 histidine kinase [Dyadobacter jejuensis]